MKRLLVVLFISLLITMGSFSPSSALSGYIDVTTFGAIPDDGIGDSTAIQSAIDSLDIAKGIVYFPPGSYLIDTSLSVTHTGVYLEGCGMSSILVNGTSTSYAVIFGDGSSMLHHVGMSHMRVSQSANVTPTAGGGIYLNKVGNSTFEDLYLLPYPSSLYNGIDINGSYAVLLNKIEIASCLNTGFSAYGDSIDIHMADMHSDANGTHGFLMNGVSGLYATNCTAWNNSINAWFIYSGGINHYHFYVNCIGDTSGQYNWAITKLESSSLTNCWGSSQKAGSGSAYTGFFIGSQSQDLTFTSCYALNNNSHGFQNYGANWIKFIGCTALNNGQSGGTVAGISLGNGGSHITLNNNHCHDNQATKTQDYGVKTSGALDYYDISHNDLTGNSVSGLSDGATGTHKIVKDNF